MSTYRDPERTVAQVRANLTVLRKAVEAIYDAVSPDAPEVVELRAVSLTVSSPERVPRLAVANTASSTSFGDAHDLTERELEVLQLLTKDLPVKEIAARLSHSRNCRPLSPRAVETHIASIYDKLGAHSRVGAVVLAIKHNLVCIDDDDLDL